MAGTDPSQLAGLFKEAYGDDLVNLIPEAMHLIQGIDFVDSDKEEGNYYNQPVIVQQEHGFTYAAAEAGAYTLNAAIAMATANAKVQGTQMTLRSLLPYDSAAKASKSKKAFVKATELIVQNMMESASKRLEIMMLYGRKGLATAASSANASATSTVITMTTAQWADGIWAGTKGAYLDLYQSDLSTKLTANAALVVSSVDIANKAITVTGNATDIGNIDTYIAANADSATFFWYGATTSTEFAGVDAIITNTGSLFNISAATYPDLWKGISFSAASADLSFGKVLKGISQAIGRGLMEDVDLFVNPLTWANLNDDLSALRRFASQEGGKYQVGAKAIEYYGGNGLIKVKPHIFLKQGDAFALPMKRFLRPGAQDLSFKTPGRPEDIFLHAPEKNGYELRLYADQALFCETPSRCVKFTTIVNTTT